MILGDSAYPRFPWLLVPYAGTNLSPNKSHFNVAHSSTRIITEDAYGQLKGRFRLISKQVDIATCKVDQIVVACCTLHNVCINEKEAFLDEWVLDALNFSHVGPAINHTQASLEAVKSSQSPLKKLQEEIKPEGRLGGLELTITDNDKKSLGNLLSAYVSGLAKNITSRFNNCLSNLSSFSILSPVARLKPTSPEFKEYGNKEIKILAVHFFQGKEMEDKEVTKTQLEAEWAKFKFDLDAWKSLVPPSTA